VTCVGVGVGVGVSVCGVGAQFWTLGGATGLEAGAASFNIEICEQQDILCACFLPTNHLLVGGPNGCIYCFEDGMGVYSHQAHLAGTVEDDDPDQVIPYIYDSSVTTLQTARVDWRSATSRLLSVVARCWWCCCEQLIDINWRPAPPRQIVRGGGVHTLVLCPDKEHVLSGGGDGSIIKWKITTTPEFQLTEAQVFSRDKFDETGPSRKFTGMDIMPGGEGDTFVAVGLGGDNGSAKM
jgi:WD40 repeat protein